ncbi:hypothetical protein EJB05_35790, partial [Eragrostis curvula]
ETGSMASSVTAVLAILFALAFVQSARGSDLVCEELPAEVCAFAVSSGGARCVLERTPEGAPRCQTSAVRVRALSGWVESDACVRACGADRNALGLPVVGDAAAEDRRLVRSLCSAACRDACTNVFDLYATLAAGEGVSLPAFCEAQKNAAVSGNRRMMVGMSPLGAPVAAPTAAPVAVEVAAPVAAPAPSSMASSITAVLAILFALAFAVQSARGVDLVCEELPAEVCAFAVSSGGARCVLERTPEARHGARRLGARARVRALSGWVESDACVRACGADRNALGLPVVGDAAAEDRRLVRALCSGACRDACPNVFDLYATLAAGEGVSLPAFCEAQRNAAVSGNRRMMAGMSPLGAPMAAPLMAVEAPVAAPEAAPAPM